MRQGITLAAAPTVWDRSAGSLNQDQATYLDRSGNDDGALDLGDLRAFVRRQPSQ